jgi:hypothetical protein
MKVFISHQQKDSEYATTIAYRLRSAHSIDSYLDVIDQNLTQAGEDLGDHLRREMAKCTQLLAVVSIKTKESWWVPWEIGVATEKDYPLATYSGDGTMVPEYLQKWPYLRTLNDVDEYAKASKVAAAHFTSRKSYLGEDSARHSSSAEFYRTLRAALRQ